MKNAINVLLLIRYGPAGFYVKQTNVDNTSKVTQEEKDMIHY